ncbi:MULTISPECIES: hypothetical protein [Burkholderia]|uniref:Uncharacterized protein n=1 Tax=Burkholderia pyrrocinia TaxID=60550 RepID=A0A318J339_BURPY|nr:MULTISPECIES: hypothetical protein [Burkholderia]PXX41090.1 hypothetical protein NA66_1001700 [Burkholderia pyrrocinia]SFW58158.1 hypothetical protein SAMN03159384_03017 [Burkholderia sp. NFACC33-1]SFY11312.1 hypothetical protein SAMN03159408_03229 [Burkholderia sp. NFPP32]
MSENVTIDDTLRDTYASIMGRGQEGDFAQETETPEVEQQTTEETPEVAEETTEVEPEQQEAEQQQEPTEQEAAVFRPPWKKAALAEWEKLPEMARKEIERRENDFHKGIEQYKAGAQAAQEFERAVQPYMATIQSLGVTPQQAASHLMGVDHQLRYSAMPQKVGVLLQIANSYGIDLQTLANGIQAHAGEQVWQQQNPVDPRLHQLQQQVGQLTQQITNTQQQAQMAENSAIESDIAAFAADPDHEHFGILQQDMALLLQNGRAKTLEDAYDMALRQNPQTYQIWLAQQQQEWDAQRKAKVAKAKQAAANNVRPNGRASVGQPSNANETMEQTLERVAREQGLIN